MQKFIPLPCLFRGLLLVAWIGLSARSARGQTELQLPPQLVQASSRCQKVTPQELDRRVFLDCQRVSSHLSILAGSLHQQGRDQEAENLLRQQLEIIRRINETPDVVATTLSNLASVMERQSRYAEAETLNRQALKLYLTALPPEHLSIATSLNNLSNVLQREGKLREAEQFARQSLSIRLNRLGAKDPLVAQSLNGLANIISELGRYSEAESIFRAAIKIAEKTPHVEILASALSSLAIVQCTQGKHKDAEALFRESLGLVSQSFGPEHPRIATLLDYLGSELDHQGRYEEATLLLDESLRICKSKLGVKNICYSAGLSSLARVRENQGRHEEAEALLRQSLELDRKLFGDKHLTIADDLIGLADVLKSQAKWTEAQQLAQSALRISRELLGANHPKLAVPFDLLGEIMISQGQGAKAAVQLREAARIHELLLRDTASETRMQAFIGELRKENDVIYSLLLSDSASVEIRKLALSTALLRKGRTADAATVLNRLIHRHQTSTDVQERLLHWLDIRQRREALLYNGPGELQPEAYRALLTHLQQSADLLEEQLSSHLPGLTKIQPPRFDLILPEVARRIPERSALVEIVWTTPLVVSPRKAAARRGAPHYIAILLFPNQRTVSIDLGAADKVDAVAHEFLAALRDSSSKPRAPAQALYNLLLAPLQSHLAGMTELFLSLDGALNLVPFDALHDDSDYLLGRYRFHYLTSGRDLLVDRPASSSQPPLLLANPDFGELEPAAGPDEKVTVYQRLHLPALPGAQREADALRPLLGIKPLVGVDANERAVRATKAPTVLHVATHGLFFRNIALPAVSGAGRGGKPPKPSDQGPSVAESALLPGEISAMNRSALALAGVYQGYRAGSSDADGLLTAEEARSLDLEGTQLVTLSACETGLGSLSAGQGVYGLRRAFLIAGAETLVISLWRVHDQATGELMEIFYRRLLDKDKPPDRLVAMIEAMKELRGRPDGTRAHPFYWAPFLVIGKGGPLLLSGKNSDAASKR